MLVIAWVKLMPILYYCYMGVPNMALPWTTEFKARLRQSCVGHIDY